MKNTRMLAGIVLAIASVMSVSPAHADGDVRCDAGPTDTWQPLPKLRKKVWLEGWTAQKVQIEGDCYEVYARNENGQAIEAFFHPVTLEKLLVFRRGTEIFRAKGFGQ